MSKDGNEMLKETLSLVREFRDAVALYVSDQGKRLEHSKADTEEDQNFRSKMTGQALKAKFSGKKGLSETFNLKTLNNVVEVALRVEFIDKLALLVPEALNQDHANVLGEHKLDALSKVIDYAIQSRQP